MNAPQNDAVSAGIHARRLTDLTARLTDRLEAETAAFAERRPQDVVSSLAQTQDLANQYRRESAQVKASPAVIAAASKAEKTSLIEATQRFETVLARHAQAVEAARIVSEGVVRAIAHEVSAARARGTGYGSKGHAAPGDGRAITLNRSA